MGATAFGGVGRKVYRPLYAEAHAQELRLHGLEPLSQPIGGGVQARTDGRGLLQSGTEPPCLGFCQGRYSQCSILVATFVIASSRRAGRASWPH